jgi:hypothetical protein
LQRSALAWQVTVKAATSATRHRLTAAASQQLCLAMLTPCAQSQQPQVAVQQQHHALLLRASTARL